MPDDPLNDETLAKTLVCGPARSGLSSDALLGAARELIAATSDQYPGAAVT